MKMFFTWFDRLILLTLAASIGAMLQPWWAGGLKVGFFFAIGAIILHNVSSRLARPG